MITLEEKIERINELENKLKTERKKAYAKYDKLIQKINNSYKELFPFEGKFIKIKHCIYDDCNKFMYCSSVQKTTNINGEDIIKIHGWGFEFELEEYCDETYVHWNEWMDEDIRIYNIKTEIKRFEIITKDDFNQTFNEMISKLQNKFINIVDISKDKAIKYGT